MKNSKTLDDLCINTLRFLAVDAVEKARSGHPGLPMGAAAMAYVLWTRFLRHNPANPRWSGRDRFVLSAGHGSALLYALLHLTGYELSLDDLKAFRQWGSKTPGHPEYGHTPGVETTTGPLGQGLGNAVGLAIGERFLAARFNRPGFPLVDNYTYCLVGDGDLMEGISHEAVSLAGHLGLGKLICLYDDNGISIEGSTSLACSDDVARRFAACRWRVQTVADGNDTAAIAAVLRAARRTDDRPSLIIVRTHIGYGSPVKQDTAAAHGEPLGREETLAAKQNLGWPTEPSFHVPPDAREHFRLARERGQAEEAAWIQRLEAYRAAYPDLAAEWDDWQADRLPAGWDSSLAAFPADAAGMATRAASGTVLGKLAAVMGNLIGGAADLAPSTKTYLSGGGDFTAASPGGRNLRFGIREHAMGAVMNGLALYGGLRPYGATFLVFADYLRPAIRLAALMRLKVVYIFTHDSIGLGEDGPTHQPVEHLASLRAIPGLTVIRPADANETTAAWQQAIAADGPVALILSRQNLPTLDRSHLGEADGLKRGAYILREAGGRVDVVLIASGSEVQLALAAADELGRRGLAARVVSMPCWELWRAQPADYRRSVLPPGLPRLTVEAAATFGWHEHAGDAGVTLGLDRFGASAPFQQLMTEFAFTPGQVADAAGRLVNGRR